MMVDVSVGDTAHCISRMHASHLHVSSQSQGHVDLCLDNDS